LTAHLLCALTSAQSTQPASAPAATQPAAATGPATAHATSRPGLPETLPADHPQRSPYSTMKVFLIRADEAEEKPERIVDAIECMDVSKQDPETAYDVAPKLAAHLAEIINHVGVTLDNIPDDWHAPPYVYLNVPEGEIVLERQDDYRWRFSA